MTQLKTVHPSTMTMRMVLHARATVLLAPESQRRTIAWMDDAGKQAAINAFMAGLYTEQPFKRVLEGSTTEAVAEEAFDLTNNPSRQEERETSYGRHRSVSTGDIIMVEHPANPEHVEHFLCCSSGWEKLPSGPFTVPADIIHRMQMAGWEWRLDGMIYHPSVPASFTTWQGALYAVILVGSDC